jgi:hypothetical protein
MLPESELVYLSGDSQDENMLAAGANTFSFQLCPNCPRTPLYAEGFRPGPKAHFDIFGSMPDI